jgi:peptidoglycan biosynthesis protein MviN/MurJ (putative lipid II flippase)
MSFVELLISAHSVVALFTSPRRTKSALATLAVCLGSVVQFVFTAICVTQAQSWPLSNDE